MLSDLLNRNSRRELLVEFNPHQTLVAGFTRPERGTIEIGCTGEFDRDDEIGLKRWLEDHAFTQKSWTSAVCGLASSDALLRREIVQPHRLADPDYVAGLLRDECGIRMPELWSANILSPLEGSPLPPENTSRPALVCGLMRSELRGLHQRLFLRHIVPATIESSLLPLFGSIFRHMARQGDRRSVVVMIVEDDQTTAYCLGKEGVHTPLPVRNGLKSIMRSARAEFGPMDDREVRTRIRTPDDSLVARGPKLVRALGRELKILVDSSEMGTGQPVGGIYFAFLPPTLAWMAEPLAQVVERPLIPIDCNDSVTTAGVRCAIGVPPFGQHWLGAISLASTFSGSKGATSAPFEGPRPSPWHVDFKLASEQPANQLVGRRFLDTAIASALAVCVVLLTVWQLYVVASLKADTTYWESKLSSNQKTFGDLAQAGADVKTLAARLNDAYELAGSQYQLSEFVINLGKTLPANMRIDRIESNQGRIAVSGGLREPSDAAGMKLNRYLEEIRRTPSIGPLFSSIGLTALQRDEDTDWLVFEITFKPKPRS